MEPFARAFIRIARYHFAVTDSVTVTVGRLVCVNVGVILVALHAAIRIFVCQLSNSGMNGRTSFLLILLSCASTVVVS